MKNIIVSNTAWKELHKLKHQLNLRNTNQVVELLLSTKLNPDITEALIDCQKFLMCKDMNQTVVNLLFLVSEEKYKRLVEKYFNLSELP